MIFCYHDVINVFFVCCIIIKYVIKFNITEVTTTNFHVSSFMTDQHLIPFVNFIQVSIFKYNYMIVDIENVMIYIGNL